MSWQVQVLPEAAQDPAEAGRQHEIRQPGLGAIFIEEVTGVWDVLAENPLLNSRRHLKKNIHWRYPDRFPYRVVYEVNEATQIVTVATVLHAARQDHHWKGRL